MLSGLAAMELKVWVDGIQRVVCGVSEQTTCQEVVIALAQAIGEFLSTDRPSRCACGGAWPRGPIWTPGGWGCCWFLLPSPSCSSQMD